MKKNPKTYAEFLLLPVGPDDGKAVSKSLYPLEDGDIMGVTEKETGESWGVWQYEDGTRFRFING